MHMSVALHNITSIILRNNINTVVMCLQETVALNQESEAIMIGDQIEHCG